MADTPKPAAKKAPAKKVAKKAVVTKVAKKTVLKKAPAKKAAKKAVAKRAAVKKTAARKAAPKNTQNSGATVARENKRIADQAKALGDQVLKSSQRVTSEASETLQLAARQARRFSTEMFNKGLDLAKKHPAEAAGLAAAATALAAAIAKARKK